MILLLSAATEYIRRALERSDRFREEGKNLLVLLEKVLSSFGMLCHRSELVFGRFARGFERRPGAMM